MTALINRTLTEHRGSPRIYLDDALLDELGVNQESPHYDRLWEGNKLILKLSDNGKYKVSSKVKSGGRVNVIDINTSKLSDIFEVNSKLRIIIKKGLVVIQAHSSELAIKQREDRFINAIVNNTELKKGSTFHGGGVMDNALYSGFAKSGVASVVSFAIEIDSRYLNSSMINNEHIFNKETVFINSDIALVHTHNMQQVDILSGGIPCTGASLSGRAKNKLQFAESHESAGACFFSFLNIVKGSNPSVVIIENVKQYMKTASFEVIKSVLASLGYDLMVDVYNGLDFNASESRNRMVCIAISKGLNSDGFLSSIEEKIQGKKSPPTPIADILDDIPLNDPSWKEVAYLKDKAKRDLEAGKGFAMQILDSDAKYCGVLGAGYAKSRSTEPRLCHPVNAVLSRLFNKREHARIKKAPEYIVDGLSETVAHQVLGNGVIWSLFDVIGQAIAETALELFSSRKPDKVAA